MYWVVVRILTGPAATLTLPLLSGFAMILAAVIPFTRASYLRITQAQTSEDGAQVVITNPHPHFLSELNVLVGKTSHQS